MEKKKKDNKVNHNIQEIETNEYLNKEDTNQTVVGHIRKNSKTLSPPHDNVASLPQQHPPILQWAYTPQPAPAPEQSLSMPKHPPRAQQNPPIIVRQNSLNPQQQNPINHHLQHGPSHVTQSAGAFWLPPRPRIHIPGASYQSFASPIGTSDSGWQVGGASSGNEPVSAYCYQGGYSHPLGLPGPWDPSSWWGQAQQSQPPPYSFQYPACAGAYGYFAVPPHVPDTLALGGQYQRGVIRPSVKLSQKHQQMWEAQSDENIRLWSALGRAEAEIAAYRSRLMELEAEVLSLKPQCNSTMAELAVAGASLTMPTSKKGRLKRPVASISPLSLPDDPQMSKSRGRKSTMGKVQSETRGPSSEKESLNNAEDSAKSDHPILGVSMATSQEVNDGKISNIFANIQPTLTFHNSVHHDVCGTQISAVGINPTVEIKGNDKEEDRKTAFSILSHPVKGSDMKGATPASYGGMNNETHVWASNILSEDCGRNVADIRSHVFYDTGSIVMRQGGKAISNWNFVNDDASEEHGDVMGSRKVDEEDMEEDASSAREEISRPKAEAAFRTDPSVAVPKGLPQMNRW